MCKTHSLINIAKLFRSEDELSDHDADVEDEFVPNAVPSPTVPRSPIETSSPRIPPLQPFSVTNQERAVVVPPAPEEEEGEGMVEEEEDDDSERLMDMLDVKDHLVLKKPGEEGPDIRGGSSDALVVHATTAAKNGESAKRISNSKTR